MKIKICIFAVLALVLILLPPAPKGRVFVGRQEPEEQENFFEMSLEDLMEVKVTSVSKEKLPEAAAAIRLLDSV